MGVLIFDTRCVTVLVNLVIVVCRIIADNIVIRYPAVVRLIYACKRVVLLRGGNRRVRTQELIVIDMSRILICAVQRVVIRNVYVISIVANLYQIPCVIHILGGDNLRLNAYHCQQVRICKRIALANSGL